MNFLIEKFGKSKKKHPQKTITSFNKTDAITIFFASKKSTGEKTILYLFNIENRFPFFKKKYQKSRIKKTGKQD